MILSTLFLILKIVAVVVLLLAMVLVLLGIGHLFNKETLAHDEDVSKLKREMKEREEVISRHSVFHSFLVREITKSGSRK